MFVPQRPGLPGRTISAPAGGLFKLDSKLAEDTGNKIEQTVIEEDENMALFGRNGVPSTRVSDEVRPEPPVL
jgi:hypothetical protein